MNQIVINCTEIASMAEFHEAIARELNFPSWYGTNYDALHDQLTALTEETRLILTGEPPFPTRILMRVLKDCQEENPLLSVVRAGVSCE
jgi:ribonuclease inhibitor